MSYKLQKPYTEQQYKDFIVSYNHNRGLRIEETENAIFALADNEILINGIPLPDPNHEQAVIAAREELFNKEFFKTTKGWIRRKVKMKDGSIKDFLGDLLLQIKAGLEFQQEIKILTYETPDFTREITSEYLESLQSEKLADLNFVRECLIQTVNDFGIQEGGSNGI